MSKNVVLRPVVWIGESKKLLKKMPEDVQKQLGGELYLAQRGEKPPHGKTFKGIGSGAFEIKDDFDSDTYRLVYAVQIGTRLYVLHAFQKKSKKGIATPKRSIEVIQQRLAAAERDYRERQN